MRAPDRGRVFFFAPRAPWAHSLTLLFVEMFYRLCPREKDSTPNKKKTRPVRDFFFAPRVARAHSLTLLFVEMFYRLGPREKDSTPNKKKHVQCAFFLLPARPWLTHSRFFLWKCFIGSAPERRTAHRTKKKHVQCAFFFLLPARPGLTHSLVPVVEYYKCWKQKTERTRNKKNRKWHAYGAKKNACSPAIFFVRLGPLLNPCVNDRNIHKTISRIVKASSWLLKPNFRNNGGLLNGSLNLISGIMEAFSMAP